MSPPRCVGLVDQPRSCRPFQKVGRPQILALRYVEHKRRSAQWMRWALLGPLRTLSMRIVHSLATLTLLVLGASLAGGCVDNRATLFIDHVLGQESDSDECDVDPQGDVFRSRGTFDPLGDRSLIEIIAIGNQMVPLGDNETLKAETSRVQIEWVRVSIEGPSGYEGETFNQNLSGTIHPDPSVNPGYVAIGVEMIPGGSGLNMPDGEYLVNLEVHGTTLGGQKLESGTFSYPVRVANGSHAACGYTAEELLDLGQVDPCGGVGQNGYPYACPDGATRPRGCAVCN